MKPKGLGSIAVVLVALLVVLAACSSGTTQAPASGGASAPAKDASAVQVAPGKLPVLPAGRDLTFEEVKAAFKQIEEAANKEGKVTYYGPIENLADTQKLWAQKYPSIQLEVVPARPNELLARMETEQASKNYVGDILGQTAGTHFQAIEAGLIAKSNLEKILPAMNDPGVDWAAKPIPQPQGYYIDGFMFNIFGIGINTKMVPPDKEPKTWKDLTDPYWKGKMVADWFDRLGIGGNWYVLMNKYPDFGAEYLDKMAKQEIKFLANRENLVAQGEYALGFPLNGMLLMQMPKGTPVKFIFPEDGYHYSARSGGIIANAPHPNAAIVFLEFFLSKEAQLAATKEGRVLARNDVPHPIPEMQNIKGKRLLTFGDDWEAKKPALFEDAKKRFAIK
ncbi:MAG: extracellular solute-binding protein [Chloroflexi bacterium]|nr:extracellular solute-binding protein [Chloroflexota bacterium]